MDWFCMVLRYLDSMLVELEKKWFSSNDLPLKLTAVWFPISEFRLSRFIFIFPVWLITFFYLIFDAMVEASSKSD